MEMDDPNRQQQTYTSSNSNNSKREREREKERMSVVLDVGPSQTTTTAMTSEASGDERYVRLSVNFQGGGSPVGGVISGVVISPLASAFEHFVVSYSFLLALLLR